MTQLLCSSRVSTPAASHFAHVRTAYSLARLARHALSKSSGEASSTEHRLWLLTSGALNTAAAICEYGGNASGFFKALQAVRRQTDCVRVHGTPPSLTSGFRSRDAAVGRRATEARRRAGSARAKCSACSCRHPDNARPDASRAASELGRTECLLPPRLRQARDEGARRRRGRRRRRECSVARGAAGAGAKGASLWPCHANPRQAHSLPRRAAPQPPHVYLSRRHGMASPQCTAIPQAVVDSYFFGSYFLFAGFIGAVCAALVGAVGAADFELAVSRVRVNIR